MSVRSNYRSQLENERIETLAALNKGGQEFDKNKIRQGLLDIKAPTDGVVKDLAAVNPGQVVSAGVLLMNIVPRGEALQAEVLLKNEDAGFVAVGQPAMIKIAAFPFQKYGLIPGSVAVVSADSQDPKSMPQGQAQTLTYKALLKVDQTELKYRSNSGTALQLQPGMLVLAEIHQGQRTVMEYLLSPVKKVAQEAARER